MIAWPITHVQSPLAFGSSLSPHPVSVESSLFLTVEMPLEVQRHFLSGCSFNCDVKAQDSSRENDKFQESRE